MSICKKLLLSAAQDSINEIKDRLEEKDVAFSQLGEICADIKDLLRRKHFSVQQRARLANMLSRAQRLRRMGVRRGR